MINQCIEKLGGMVNESDNIVFKEPELSAKGVFPIFPAVNGDMYEN